MTHLEQLRTDEDAAWEDFENMEPNDPNYSSARHKYFDAAREAAKESNREITKLLGDLVTHNEKLLNDLADLKAQMRNMST